MSDTLRASNLHFGLNASNYNQPQIGFTSVGIGSTANYGFLQFFGTSNTLCWTANGTVGIGTTNPSAKLHVIEVPVNGDVSRREMFRGVCEYTLGVQNSVSMAFALGPSTSGANPFGVLDIKLNGTPQASNLYGNIPDITVMSVIGNGNVGIGITNPGTTLDVNGITRSTGLINTGYTYATISGTIPALASSTTTWATTTTLSGGVSASAPTPTAYVYLPYGTYAGSSSTVTNWSMTPTVSNYAGRWYIPYTGIWSLSWTMNIGSGSATPFISINSCNGNDLNSAGAILMTHDITTNGDISWTGLLLSTDYISFGAFLWAGNTCNFQTNPARTRVTLALVQRTG